MKICIPTEGSSGLNDTVYGHFGHSPYLTVVDTERDEVSVSENRTGHNGHGSCTPAEELVARGVEAVATGGMGRRALSRLNENGIRVFVTTARTPAEAVRDIVSGAAEECTPEAACAGRHGGQGGHGGEHGHGHHHHGA
jgi:predicted Fe-Mo cluster-binding NifX family protein